MGIYTQFGPFTNSSASPPINAQFVNAVDTTLTTLGVLFAPAPTGVAATDQANLNPLILASQTTGAPVQLQPGTYVGNFTGNQAFEQPIIRGAGKHLTTVRAASNSTPVFKFRGGSGGISGGRLEHLTIAPVTTGGGIGVDFSGCGGVQVNDVRFTTGFDRCGQFHNELGNDFTEYCIFNDCEFNLSATGYAVVYQVDNGIESFHGSGLRGACVINVASGWTGPAILINTTAFPYQAPLEFDIFPQNSATVLIQNNSGSRQADFFGSIRIELGASNVTVALGYAVWFAGSIHELGAAGTRLGTLERIDMATYNQAGTFASRTRKAFAVPVTNVKTNVTPKISNGSIALDGNMSGLIQLLLQGANYIYVYQLLAYQNPDSAGGDVYTLRTARATNNAGYNGTTTFTWENYGLNVLNTSFPATSAITAYVDIIPFGIGSTNQLPQ